MNVIVIKEGALLLLRGKDTSTAYIPCTEMCCGTVQAGIVDRDESSQDDSGAER